MGDFLFIVFIRVLIIVRLSIPIRVFLSPIAHLNHNIFHFQGSGGLDGLSGQNGGLGGSIGGLLISSDINQSILAGSNGGQIPVEPSPIIEGPEGVHMVRLQIEVKRRESND